jgi:hypothetical protein
MAQSFMTVAAAQAAQAWASPDAVLDVTRGTMRRVERLSENSIFQEVF